MQNMPVEQIIYNNQLFTFFQSEVEKYPFLETGGVLLGFLKNKTIFIEKASGPGKVALHEPYYFRADPNYVSMFIDMEIANSQCKLRYLGEWHSHLQIEPDPSTIDLASLSEIAESSSDFCLMLVLGAVEFNAKAFYRQSISVIKFKGIDEFYIYPQ